MKARNEVVHQAPQFAILADSPIRDLHLAALEVLRRIGVRFHHREALELLKKAGAFISDDNLVRFPARLIWDYILDAG